MPNVAEFQHINVKLFVQNPGDIDLDPLIPVFQTWIQDQGHGELLLDIADYRHVEAGPGVILIGHEGNYSVDNANNRLGVRYNRKAPLAGNNQDRLVQATRAALTACRRLEAEPLLGGKLRFNGHEMQIFINDRLLAPNNDETREAVREDFQSFFEKLFRAGEYSISYNHNSRELFAVFVKTTQPSTVTELLERLS